MKTDKLFLASIGTQNERLLDYSILKNLRKTRVLNSQMSEFRTQIVLLSFVLFIYLNFDKNRAAARRVIEADN